MIFLSNHYITLKALAFADQLELIVLILKLLFRIMILKTSFSDQTLLDLFRDGFISNVKVIIVSIVLYEGIGRDISALDDGVDLISQSDLNN